MNTHRLVEITVQLSPEMQRRLEVLHRSGLWGDSLRQVARRLLEQRLRQLDAEERAEHPLRAVGTECQTDTIRWVRTPSLFRVKRPRLCKANLTRKRRRRKA